MKVSENSSEIKRVRDHVVGFEPPDICLIQFGETLTRDDSLALLEEELRLAKEHGDIFVLVDFTRVRSITAEARKLSAETTSPPAILGVANFGVSFQVRVLTKLVVSLRRLAKLPVEGLLYLGADEADARAWIARRKLELKQTRG
ncbi:MAG TPA: hypothetical protein VE093_31145 [Polyangiaceae bacterium]|nr:hypothetical protein [Polyangiaceae bacterium]